MIRANCDEIYRFQFIRVMFVKRHLHIWRALAVFVWCWFPFVLFLVFVFNFVQECFMI